MRALLLKSFRHCGKHKKQVGLRWITSPQKASQLLEERQQRASGKRNLLAQLKVCRNLQRAKELHTVVIGSGNRSCIYVATALVNMYAKCGSMSDARQVFDGIEHPDVVSWTALILGYVDNGEGYTALELFARMKSQGCAQDSFTCVAALKACTSLIQRKTGTEKAECLERGKQIHSEILNHLNIYVQNALIDMYAKCGSMVDARQVFDGVKHPDVVSYNSLMLGYTEKGESRTALDLFARMKSQGCVPTFVSYVIALKACTSLALKQDDRGKTECLERGKQIHLEIGCQSNICVQSSLIDMYAKCRSMHEARQVFDSIKKPDVVSWNALMLGYTENGEGITALDLFSRMKSQGCAPDCIAFVAALKACTSIALKQDRSGKEECLEMGKRIHSEIHHHSDIYVQNTLIDMYSKCGSMVDAHQVFDSIKRPDVVSWNALMLGYVENGGGTVLGLLAMMRSQGCAPDRLTFVAVLKACGLLGALDFGRKIHAEVEGGIEIDVMLVTCLVDFYAKCGCMAEAQKVFDSQPRTRDLITWNALLAGYSRLGENNAVFGLFEKMQDTGFLPDVVTFSCILTCCSHAGLVAKANKFFEAMSTNYGLTPTLEHYNCMVDILGRSNKLCDAIALMHSMPCKPGAVTWMTVLGACRKWKNVEIGRLAFNSLVSLDDTNAAAYVLMGHLYGSRGMWEEQEMLLRTSKIPTRIKLLDK